MAVHEFNTDKLSIEKYNTGELKHILPMTKQIYGDRYIERWNNDNEMKNDNRKNTIKEINKLVQAVYYDDKLMAINIKMKNYSEYINGWYINATCSGMDERNYSKLYIIDDEILRTINIINKHYEGTNIEPIEIEKVEAIKIKIDEEYKKKELKKLCNRSGGYIMYSNFGYVYIIRVNTESKNLIDTFRNEEYEITEVDALVLDNRNYDLEFMAFISWEYGWNNLDSLSFLILPHFKEDNTIYKRYFLPFLY